MKLGKKIRILREEKGLSQTKLAEKTGIHRSQISRIENGIEPPFQSFIKYKLLADILGANAQELWEMGQEDRQEWKAKEHFRQAKILKPGILKEFPEAQPIRLLPVLNKIKAGKLIGWTDQDYPPGWADEWEPCPSDVTDPQAFALDVEGDSMAPVILQGDRIIVSPNTPVENGQIAVVANNEGKTVKRIHFKENQILLTSDNPKYPPIIWTKKDRSKIIGRVIRVNKKL